VLIVDDEVSILFAVGRYLAMHGFDVCSATTLEDATACIISRGFHAVITDVRLGGTGTEEGLEVLRCTKTRRPATLVIVQTACATADLRSRACAMGADAFFEKPVSLPILASLIEERVLTAAVQAIGATLAEVHSADRMG
jgi:DNA-binding NtrC family response regulator